jgi:hypothetical protein
MLTAGSRTSPQSGGRSSTDHTFTQSCDIGLKIALNLQRLRGSTCPCAARIGATAPLPPDPWWSAGLLIVVALLTLGPVSARSGGGAVDRRLADFVAARRLVYGPSF